MNTKSKIRLRSVVRALLIVALLLGVGCRGAGEQLPSTSPGELSSTLVPNVELDLYAYARQDSPTIIPAGMINAPDDIEVEALAVWGVPAENDFTFGMGFTLTNASDASRLYDEINPGEGGWKRLDGNTIFWVDGSGTAAESLKAAISNRDFKQYDDSEALDAIAALPSNNSAKLAAIAIAKPSEELISFLSKDVSDEASGQINMILKLLNLKVAAAGLYAPDQIDISRIALMMEDNGSISDIDVGMLLLVKSGLPGFVVKPALEKFLTEYGFTETNLGGLTIYKSSWGDNGGVAISILVRIEGSQVFAAISGQEAYAETLITSVNE